MTSSPRLDEARKRLINELVALLDGVEDGPPKDEETAVDPDVGARERIDGAHDAALVRLDDVVLDAGPHGDEESGLPLTLERLDHVVERRVREPVAVGREERRIVTDVGLHQLQPLPDRGVQAGVDESDCPVLDVACEELNVAAAVRENEIVGYRFLVREEVVLDRLAPVAEAEDEFGVPPRGVPLHDVPEDRPSSDGDHRLGNPLGCLAHADTEAAAEDHDLHLPIPRTHTA